MILYIWKELRARVVVKTVTTVVSWNSTCLSQFLENPVLRSLSHINHISLSLFRKTLDFWSSVFILEPFPETLHSWITFLVIFHPWAIWRTIPWRGFMGNPVSLNQSWENPSSLSNLERTLAPWTSLQRITLTPWTSLVRTLAPWTSHVRTLGPWTSLVRTLAPWTSLVRALAAWISLVRTLAPWTSLREP